MRGIVKRFGAAVALTGVDLELAPGEVHAVLGENGAGKSTLMHVLSGSLRPDGGEIRIDESAVRIDSPRAARQIGISMVHQHFALVPAFTVAENLALDAGGSDRGPVNTGRTPLARALPALEQARALGWDLAPGARTGELPIGIQQRVEIAKALATKSAVLIFDEPTAVLAGSEVDELFEVLRRLRDAGRTVVLIAHKLAEILAVADRVTVLRHGERVATAPRSAVDARRLAGWMMGAESPERQVEAPAAAAASVKPIEMESSVGKGPPSLLAGPTDAPTSIEARTALPGPLAHSSARTPRSPAFAAVDLHIFGRRGESVIRGVSLEVGRGEIFGIGGVDGNGQGELAEALAGLRAIDSGTVTWDQGLFAPGRHPATGYIPQDRRGAGLALGMSVEENLLLDAPTDRRFRSGPLLRTRLLRATAADLMTRFDIRAPGLDSPAATLSGGNQQKIVVARALRASPDWIVAVSPTRGLDIGATRFVHGQLRAARERGAAVLLISTDLDEITALADRAAILSSGTLTEFDIAETHAEEIGLLLGGLPGEGAAIGTTPA